MRRAPGDNVLPARPVPNGRRRSEFWLVPENHQKSERRRPFGTGMVRQCPQGLFSPIFTFLRAIFFRPLRLSLAPTICPWVSEDALRNVWQYFLARLLRAQLLQKNYGFPGSKLCSLRPRPHVSGDFCIRKSFYADTKISASTRSVYESYTTVHKYPIRIRTSQRISLFRDGNHGFKIWHAIFWPSRNLPWDHTGY